MNKWIRNANKAQVQENYLMKKQTELLKRETHNYLNKKLMGMINSNLGIDRYKEDYCIEDTNEEIIWNMAQTDICRKC